MGKSKTTTTKDTTSLSLTIYNGGFGVVKEVRGVQLEGDETELVFMDVAQKIETDSLLVEGLDVQEFNYEYDLVDRQKLLMKYLDKQIILKDRKNGITRPYRLLSAMSGERCVLEDVETKEIIIDTQAEMILPSLPSGLLVKPALLWKIREARLSEDQTREIKVSYLSQGFNWSANYIVELLDKTMNLSGWAEIMNESGATYDNAKIKLIAGDVHRADPEVNPNYLILQDESDIRYSSAPEVEEKAFFDYHMYTMRNTTTLKDNQTKQISILNGSGIPYKRIYTISQNSPKVPVTISFVNSKASGLGIPMPMGKIKLYKADESDGSLEFIGEDRIDHTPKDEEIELELGNAFDLSFQYDGPRQTKKDGYDYYRYTVTVRNHKNEEAEVHVTSDAFGAYELVSASHPLKDAHSSNLVFIAVVPAQKNVTVTFEFRYDRRVKVEVK